MVWDVSRWNHCEWFGDDLANIYDELRDEIRKCMEEKGKYKNKPKNEEARVLNIARDCLIAITSTDYNYFVTSDKCLYESWMKILKKSETKKILKNIPNIIYEEPDPKKILDQILEILKS